MAYRYYNKTEMEGGTAAPATEESSSGMTVFEFFLGNALASCGPSCVTDVTPDAAADWAFHTASLLMRKLDDARDPDGIAAWRRPIPRRRIPKIKAA